MISINNHYVNFKRSLFIASLILSGCASQDSGTNKDAPANRKTHQSKTSNVFKLDFAKAGLGSNMGRKMQSFKIRGNQYEYLKKQNSSWDGEYTSLSDTISIGVIRQSSIDSISQIISEIKDTLVYVTNPNIRSGSIDYLTIYNEQQSITFKMHNASHKAAQKIIQIINSNLPKDVYPLRVWED